MMHRPAIGKLRLVSSPSHTINDEIRTRKPRFIQGGTFRLHSFPVVALAAVFLVSCSNLPAPETGKTAAELNGISLEQADGLLKKARRLAGDENARSVYRLRAAEIAWGKLSPRSGTVRDIKTLPDSQQHALHILAASAEALAPLFVGDKALSDRSFALAGHSYRVHATRADKTGVYPPMRLIAVKPAGRVPRKLTANWHVEAGAGAPLAPTWKAPADPRMRRFVPPRGYIEPLTAVLDFTDPAKPGTVRTATLTGCDPTAISTVRIGGAQYPLAADFTAPIVDRTLDINEFWLALQGLLFSDARDAGLAILEPYDRTRIPVVFVHGLNSHPRMWRDVINDLRADPGLRGRYQFWVFYYPTGWPIVYSALRLREELAALDKVTGPQHRMVFIGHSMGGLLSRMQVISPRRVIWDALLGKEADHLYATLPDDSLAKRTLLFHANPEIGRVIFICTPHRGSALADMSISGFFSNLVRLPGRITRGVAALPASILRGRRLTSINGLSPSNPVFTALDKVPIEAPHHSIIGDRGKGGNHDRIKPRSSDGVVDYWSSHLDSAQSELILPDGHGAYGDPKAIEEMKRILKLHLSSGR